MKPLNAYQQDSGPEWTRIQMLLAIFDGAIERCETARQELEDGHHNQARSLLLVAQQLVSHLAAGMIPGSPGATDRLRLYEFVVRQMAGVTDEKIADAVRILTIMRSGFDAIREEAIALERSGAIPPLGKTCLVNAMA